MLHLSRDLASALNLAELAGLKLTQGSFNLWWWAWRDPFIGVYLSAPAGLPLGDCLVDAFASYRPAREVAPHDLCAASRPWVFTPE